MAIAVSVRRRPPRATRDLILAFLVVVAALAAALFASIKGPELTGGNALVLLPFVAIPLWMLLTDRPQVALAVLLLYVGLIDGFIKLKVGTELPTLGRDLLLYALAIGMVLKAVVNGRRLDLPPLSGWVGVFVLLVLVQLLNPQNQSLLHSVAALRQHIEFVPLFFIAYALMRSKDRLRVFFLLLLVVANVNGAVAFVQFNMSPAQLASWGPGYSDLINGRGVAPRTAVGADGKQRVRPPGLGSDMGFAGTVGIVALPGALALLALRRFNRRQAVLAGLLTPGTVVAIVTSQSRSVIVAAAIAVVIFALLSLLAGQALRIALAGVAALVLALSAVSVVGGESQNDAFYRYTSVAPSSVVSTTLESRRNTLEQIPLYAQEFPLGAGIGSVGPAASFDGAPKPLNAESQFTFMIVELGIAGLLVYMAFQARILAGVVAGLRWLRDTEARLLVVALVTPLVAFMALWVTGVTTTSSPNAPYIWFAAGTAMWWMYRSEPLESRRRSAPPGLRMDAGRERELAPA